MERALDEARKAALAGEAPIGAVLVGADGAVLAAAGNAPIGTNDPTAHAEILVLREAAKLTRNYRLSGATLYVTLEPCAMCAGAISHARVARLIIAAEDAKGGAVFHGPKFFEQSTCHWRPEVVKGPYGDDSAAMLREFFRARR
ncbi:MAG: tRNA-specific adenosine deaminase [Alphaproteobacteria bacterium RIFCSPHIGHO2_12_FULL_63_12]|nr:MAG: tRNA-specific adenosine deaminase [Alphaproteobacteria bacterium RIFCSPHIGHO2_12_FULL_63_12]